MRCPTYCGTVLVLASPAPLSSSRGGCSAERAAPATALRIPGLSRLRPGSPRNGLDLLTRAFDRAPEDKLIRLHYGIDLRSDGRHAEAAELFRQCEKLLPVDPAPSLLALGDVRGSIAAAREGRLYEPAMAESHYILGSA